MTDLLKRILCVVVSIVFVALLMVDVFIHYPKDGNVHTTSIEAGE